METPNSSSPSTVPADVDPRGRLVYVVSQDGPTASADDEMDLFRLWEYPVAESLADHEHDRGVRRGVGGVCVVLAPMYTASVVLAPVRDEPLSGLASQLGGLASLAGIARAREGQYRSRRGAAVTGFRPRIHRRARAPARCFSLKCGTRRPVAGRWRSLPTLSQAPVFLSGTVRDVEEDSHYRSRNPLDRVAEIRNSRRRGRTCWRYA